MCGINVGARMSCCEGESYAIGMALFDEENRLMEDSV